MHDDLPLWLRSTLAGKRTSSRANAESKRTW